MTTPRKAGRKPGIPCLGLAAAIERSGLSVTAAAERAKLGRTQVFNWITRLRAPKVELERLAKTLGTTLERLAIPPEADPQQALEQLEAAEQRLQEAREGVRQARAAIKKLKTGS